MRVAGLLLAAGESTRMGEPKALLPWQGTTLLEHQVSSFTTAGLSPTVVVLGHESDRLLSLVQGRLGITCVYNPNYQRGKTTSIKAGVRALQSVRDNPSAGGDPEAILLLNVDQPRSADLIGRITELDFRGLRHDQGGKAPLITVPTFHEKGGHPVVLSILLLTELMEIREETLGLKAVMRMHEAETQRIEMESPEILLDLNTPEDYDKALEASVSA